MQLVFVVGRPWRTAAAGCAVGLQLHCVVLLGDACNRGRGRLLWRWRWWYM
jgi:hypothetical protein